MEKARVRALEEKLNINPKPEAPIHEAIRRLCYTEKELRRFGTSCTMTKKQAENYISRFQFVG